MLLLTFVLTLIFRTYLCRNKDDMHVLLFADVPHATLVRLERREEGSREEGREGKVGERGGRDRKIKQTETNINTHRHLIHALSSSSIWYHINVFQ